MSLCGAVIGMSFGTLGYTDYRSVSQFTVLRVNALFVNGSARPATVAFEWAGG